MFRATTHINRRNVVIGAAGALAATAGFPLHGRAQESSFTPEVVHYDVAGRVHAFSVGDFQCVAASDGSSLINDPNDLLYFYNLAFGQSPTEQVHEALATGGYDADLLIRQDTCLHISTGEHSVLIDTGFGSAFGGILASNLEEAGVQAEDIDVVITTHAHPDHIGGNVDDTGAPAFPNARYVMAEREWEFWTDMAQVEESVPNEEIRGVILQFVESQMLTIAGSYDLVGFDTEIVPGITSIESPGHTPGHMSLLVESRGERLWVGGDAATHPVTVRHPSLAGFADIDPAEMERTRRRMFEEFADSGDRVLFGHFDPFPGIGKVTAQGDAWRWEEQSFDD